MHLLTVLWLQESRGRRAKKPSYSSAFRHCCFVRCVSCLQRRSQQTVKTDVEGVKNDVEDVGNRLKAIGNRLNADVHAHPIIAGGTHGYPW